MWCFVSVWNTKVKKWNFWHFCVFRDNFCVFFTNEVILVKCWIFTKFRFFQVFGFQIFSKSQKLYFCIRKDIFVRFFKEIRGCSTDTTVYSQNYKPLVIFEQTIVSVEHLISLKRRTKISFLIQKYSFVDLEKIISYLKN